MRVNPLYLLEYPFKINRKIQRKFEVIDEIDQIVPGDKIIYPF